jgi:hypothetical protein
MVMDIQVTGTSGYQGADWIREHRQLDLHVGDQGGMVATMSFADDDHTVKRLITALSDWRHAARGFEKPSPDRAAVPPASSSWIPSYFPATPSSAPPRWFLRGRQRAGSPPSRSRRIRPGVPAVVPGEELNDAVIDYLRSGVDADMTLPDPTI